MIDLPSIFLERDKKSMQKTIKKKEWAHEGPKVFKK
jgi:hypothetical protein